MNPVYGIFDPHADVFTLMFLHQRIMYAYPSKMGTLSIIIQLLQHNIRHNIWILDYKSSTRICVMHISF